MENIGDWLYVVILIIAAISSIFSSVRKKAKQASTETRQSGQQGQTPQTQQREIFKGDVFDDDYWGESSANQQLPEVKVAPVVQQSPRKPMQPSGTTPKYSDYNYNKLFEGQSGIANKNFDFTFADNEEEHASITLEDLPSESEEWRKALVYNEIINRKY